MGSRGFGQAETDEMELWVIARLLGLHKVQPLTREEHMRQAVALAEARARAAAAGEPPPQVTPVDNNGMVVSEAQMEALRARRAARAKDGGT